MGDGEHNAEIISMIPIFLKGENQKLHVKTEKIMPVRQIPRTGISTQELQALHRGLVR